MRGKSIHHAIDAGNGKGIDTDLVLYDMIENLPGENIYKISQKLGWTTAKTYAAARRLEKAGMVHVEKAVKNGRQVLVVKPKSWREYFTPEELEEMSQPGYFDEVEEILKKSKEEQTG